MQWEPLPIPRVPGLNLWVWYRPQHLPSGISVSFPAEVIAAYPTGFPFTLSDIILASGVVPAQIQAVSFFGAEWQPANAIGAYFNAAVPLVPANMRPEISIAVNAPLPAAIPPMASGGMSAVVQNGYAAEVPANEAVAEPAATGTGRSMYDRIESAWRSAIQMERQMTGLRQKLSSIMGQLGKLDRDLKPDERLAADREDRDAWHDARRWVRDLAAKCHREIKSFDIGMTSAAGKRNWMEEQFKQIVEPRKPSNDLETVHREFETYRKDMVNLQKAMNSALQAATANGTQRAQRVLGVIGKKIRERRAKMREPIGGTNMDKSVRRKK